jgi:hypothetical protein
MRKMKSIIAIATIGLVTLSTSCKKGENDPMTMKSRTARLAGEWELSTITSTQTSYDASTGDSTVTVISFDGTNHIEVVTYYPSGGSSVLVSDDTNTYSAKITFDKEGAVEYEQVWNSNAWTSEGYWYWAKGSKVADLKNKETVVLTFTEINYGQVDTYGGTAQPIDGTFQLDRLAKDEMIIIENTKDTYSNGDIESFNSSQTYVKN